MRPSVLFEAISKRYEQTKDKVPTSIFEVIFIYINETFINQSDLFVFRKNLILKYEVAKSKSPDGLFYKNLSMRPWLVYTLVNLVSLLSLTAIGFGVGIGISSRCKFELEQKMKQQKLTF
jgi:hypothetical protein